MLQNQWTREIMSLVRQAPETVARIQQTPLLNTTFHNAILMNAKSLGYMLALEVGGFFVLGSFARYPLMILHFREGLRISSLNAVNNLCLVTRLSELENADDFLQVHTFCEHCRRKDRFVGAFVIQAHYVLFSLLLSVLAQAADFWNFWALALIVFSLEIYFKGFVAWQYALSAENICPEHQRQVLLNDPQRSGSFGFVAHVPLFLLTSFFSYVFPPHLAVSFNGSATHVIGMFMMIHAIQLRFPLPLKSNLREQAHRGDPLNRVWMVAGVCVRKLMTLARESLRSQKPMPEHMIVLLNTLSCVFHHPLVQTGMPFFIPMELRDLRVLLSSPELSEHSLFLALKIKQALCLTCEYYQWWPVQAGLKLLHVQKLRDQAGGCLHTSLDIPQEVALFFLKCLMHPHFGRYLARIDDFLDSVLSTEALQEREGETIEVPPELPLSIDVPEKAPVLKFDFDCFSEQRTSSQELSRMPRLEGDFLVLENYSPATLRVL